MQGIIKKAIRSLPVIFMAGGLGACSEYMAKYDGVNLGAGDAVAFNKAAQTIDPWPRHSERTSIPGHGERMQVAIKRYIKNDTGSESSNSKSNTTKQSGNSTVDQE